MLAVTSYESAGRKWFEAQHPYGWLDVEILEERFPGGRWAGPLPVPLDAPDAKTGHIEKAERRGEETSR